MTSDRGSGRSNGGATGRTKIEATMNSDTSVGTNGCADINAEDCLLWSRSANEG